MPTDPTREEHLLQRCEASRRILDEINYYPSWMQRIPRPGERTASKFVRHDTRQQNGTGGSMPNPSQQQGLESHLVHVQGDSAERSLATRLELLDLLGQLFPTPSDIHVRVGVAAGEGTSELTVQGGVRFPAFRLIDLRQQGLVGFTKAKAGKGAGLPLHLTAAGKALLWG